MRSRLTMNVLDMPRLSCLTRLRSCHAIPDVRFPCKRLGAVFYEKR